MNTIGEKTFGKSTLMKRSRMATSLSPYTKHEKQRIRPRKPTVKQFRSTFLSPNQKKQPNSL